MISFVLGKEVSVNTIIGIPNLRQWGGSIHLGKNIIIDLFLSFNVSFYMKPQQKDCPMLLPLTQNIFRPGSISVPTILSNFNQNTIDTISESLPPPTVSNENSKKYLLCITDFNNLSTCPYHLVSVPDSPFPLSRTLTHSISFKFQNTP